MSNKKRRSKDTAKKQRNIEHDKDQHRITTTTEETKLLSKARTKVESSLIARNIVAIVFVALLSIGVHHYYQRYDHHHSSHDHDHHDHHQPVSDKNDVDKHKEERKRKGNDDSTASTQTSIKKQTVFLNKDSYEVLEVLHHDNKAFTQGLTLYNGYIYEGTGLYGSSEIRKIDPKNPSHIIQSKPLPSKYFGEGITLYKDSDGNSKIIQLTWKEQTAFVYDPDTLDVIQQFEYETSNGEGWGITFLPDTCELVVSDGSHYLIFWDCDSFQETRRVEVRYNIPGGGQQRHNDDGEIVNYINELEVIKLKNEQYAILTNVWFQDVLLQIDPLNGHVDKIYSFADSLYSVRRSQDDVFNGISVSDDNHQTLYLTGKMWPFMYKVQLKK